MLLDKKGTKLVSIIAPDKARVCSEYLPDNFKENELKINNNYKEFLKQFDDKKIAHINFNDWFLQIKDTLQIPVFAKNGIQVGDTVKIPAE